MDCFETLKLEALIFYKFQFFNHNRYTQTNSSAWIKKRQAIEPHIGHIKSEGKLCRNRLKGKLGDKLNALLCGIGHNIGLLLCWT